jgi:hypothetical protein
MAKTVLTKRDSAWLAFLKRENPGVKIVPAPFKSLAK